MVNNCSSYTSLYNSSGFYLASFFTVAAGGITILCVLSTAVVIFVSQSHRLHHFRLILYYCISAFLFAIANCINRIDYAFASDPIRRGWSCMWAGFVFQCTMWSLLISILCVTLSINIKMILKRDLKGTEPAVIFAIFVLPVMINWIPFTYHGYGLWGNYCLIRIYNETCSIIESGNASAIVLVGLPWTIGVFTIITVSVASIVLVMYRTRATKWDDKGYDGLIKKVTRREAISLLWCPFVLLLLVAPIIAVLFDNATKPTLWLWGLAEFMIALDPGLVAIAYTSRKYLIVLKQCTAACQTAMCVKKMKDKPDCEDL